MFKSFVILPSFLIAFLFLSHSTFADNIPYVGMDTGMITLSSGTQAMFNPLAGESGTNARIGLGTLWGNPQGFQYGAEADAMYFPHASFKVLNLFGVDVTYRGYSYSLLGVGKYTTSSGFFFLAKGGAAYLYEKNTDTLFVNNLIIPLSQSDGHKFAPEAALGMGYQFTPKFSCDLIADSIFAGHPYSDSSNPVTQTNTLNLGLRYHFA